MINSPLANFSIPIESLALTAFLAWEGYAASRYCWRRTYWFDLIIWTVLLVMVMAMSFLQSTMFLAYNMCRWHLSLVSLSMTSVMKLGFKFIFDEVLNSVRWGCQGFKSRGTGCATVLPHPDTWDRRCLKMSRLRCWDISGTPCPDTWDGTSSRCHMGRPAGTWLFDF